MPGTFSEAYDNARKQGLRAYRRDVVQGRSPYPAVLDDMITRDDILAEVPVGVMEIPLDLVAGTRTAGRTSAFASNFMPILKENTEFAYKWANLYSAQMTEGIRDPIKAYEYMGRFYVLEGNKRVSVSKYVGLSSIMADITRVLPRHNGTKENRIYYEFVDFFKVCPVYGITFSQEGRYAELARRFGQTLDQPWDEDTRKNLKADLAVFTGIFHSKGGDRLRITDGDAFLIYLTFYQADTLQNDTSEVIASRLDRLWNEFLTETSEDSITLVQTPEELRDKAGLLNFWKNVPSYSAEHPLRAAFIYDRSPEDSAWIYAHELGRHHLDDFFAGAVETIMFQNCSTDEQIAKAVDAAAADEDELVFTTSPTMMTETLRSAIHYPNIHFFNCSINLSHNAVRTYYIRTYEAKFIMGAIAATAAQNHKIGYLADYPIYGTLANINAFAIGAAMIDPEVRIYLSWARRKNGNWKEDFDKEGIRVISGPDMIRPKEPTREYGLYERKDNDFIQSLAAPVLNWGRYYELIVRSVLEGNWQAREIARKDNALNYWWGLSAGVIDVILSNDLSHYTAEMAELLKRGIQKGSLNPFDGELRSQQGLVREAGGPTLGNEDIITMDWLNENVIGYVPKAEELTREGQETVSVSGVASARQA